MVIHCIKGLLLVLLECLEMTKTLLLLLRLLLFLGRVRCQSMLVIVVVQGLSVVLACRYLILSAYRDVTAWWWVLESLGRIGLLLLRHHTLQLLFLREAHMPQRVVPLHRL